ncbi:MAG: hypothetical protein ACRD1V_10780 [Vicinamibacterales bacterium]
MAPDPQNPPRRLMSTPIQAGTSFAHGKPHPLFDLTGYANLGSTGRSYDVARDGRFVFSKLFDPAGSAAPPPQGLIVVTHWLDEVHARVK